MAEGDTFVNAFVGAVVTMVAGAFLPLGPLLGGGAAGYLEGGERSDGVRVGLISGAIALLPTVFLGLFVFGYVVPILMGVGPDPRGFSLVALLIGGLVVGVGYVVGLSALGGWIGNYVKYDTDVSL